MSEVKIAFRTIGEGSPIVLLHGYAGSVLHWDLVVQELKGKYQLIVPNLTHLYMSKKVLTFSQQVDVFAHFLKSHFPKQKVSIAGASYGGALLWGVALKYPELVDKTIFINPMPPAPANKFSIPVLKSIFKLPLNMQSIYLILRTPLGRFFLKRAAEVFRMERAELWDRLDGLHGRKLLFVCHVIYNFSYILRNENWNLWKQRLETWTHSSLLIYDQQDPLFEPKTYHRFQELIGCDITKEIHLAGHIATNVRGAEIAQLMDEFLDVSKKSVLTS
jgi:pimeloyl-ACP methyl ester carboxylesterase